MAEQILISVELDKQAAGKRLVELEQELLNLRNEQTELNNALKKGEISQANYAKRVLETKAGMAEAREEQRQLIAVTKAEEGSINALRVRLSALTKERNATNQSTEAGVKAASALDKQILSLTQRIQQNENASGDFRRAVGSYKDSILDAAKAQTIFGVNVGQVSTLMGTAAGSIGGASKALNVFKVALASTGIGAVVVAIGALVAYFTKSQRGADQLNKVLTVVGSTMSVLTDRAVQLGEGLVNVFTLNFSAAGENFKNATTGIYDEIVNEGKQAFALEEDFQELQRRRLSFMTQEATMIREIELLRTQGENRALTAAQREESLQKALQLTRNLTQERLGIQKEEVRILEQRQAMGENMLEDDQAMAEARKGLIELEYQTLEQQRTITSQINNTRNEQITLEKQLAAEQKKRIQEVAKLEAQHAMLDIQERLLTVQRGSEEELALQKQLIDAKTQMSLIGVSAESQARINAEKEANIERLRLEQDFQTARKEQQEASVAEFNEMLSADIESMNQMLNEKVNQSVSTRIEAEKKGLEAQKAIEEQRLAVLDNTLGLAASTFKQHTIAHKVAASIQAGVNAWLGFTEALTNSVIPFPLRQINAIAVLASGLAAVGKINNIKLADGGVLPDSKGGVLRGKTHGQGGIKFSVGGGVPVEAEDQEILLTRGVYRDPQLRALASQLNVAGGGRAFFAAGGVLGQNIARNNLSNTVAGAQFQRAMQDLPPVYVAVTDINKGMSNYARVTDKAKI